jgi:tetratricopeptide (TPR) repeat protein
MDPRRWRRVRDVFERSLDLPERERPGFVEQAADDEAVRRAVRRLAACHAESSAFLEPLDGGLAASHARLAAPGPGELIGAYRLERVLGSGGMGTVFLAVQPSPKRKVALKVMRTGFGSPPALRRFQVEAEILGGLRHPGIATIYELGTHAGPAWLGSLPFIAMEFVEGARDLVGYAREARLGVRARVELFREVCAAVQYAHGKGVIHRDLKPGNVLIDAAGRPKLIDFGIARSVEPGPAREPGTLGDGALGTLAYASPEQLSGDPRDIDVRVDVYALGAVLYELLAGRPAYSVGARPLGEALADIGTRMPPPPSSFAPEVPAELDWVVLKCLRKEREQRYPTAAELSADLDRYLRDEPVGAAPPTLGYRARKFVARNRLAVTAAGLVLASLIGGIVATRRALAEAREQDRQKGVALDEARRQSEKAALALRRQTAVVDAMGRLFDAVRPDAAGRDVTLVQLLEARRSGLDAELASDPELHATLQEFLATGYFNLGLIEPTAELAEPALRTLEAIEGAEPVLLGRLRLILARCRLVQGRHEEARALLERTLADPQFAGAMRSKSGVAALALQAELCVREGRHELAVEAYRELVRFSEEVLGPDDPQTLDAEADLAVQLSQDNGREEEAERWARRAHERAVAALGAEHPRTLSIAWRVASVLWMRGEVRDALVLQREVLQQTTKMYGEAHPNTLLAMQQLVLSLVRTRELAEAEALARRGVELATEQRADDPHQEVSARISLARVLETLGRTDDAAQEYGDAMLRLEAAGLARDPNLVVLGVRLAALELARGSAESAEMLASDALALGSELYPPEHATVVVARLRLGQALLALGQLERAEAELSAAHAIASVAADRQTAAMTGELLKALIELNRRRGNADEVARLQLLLDGAK